MERINSFSVVLLLFSVVVVAIVGVVIVVIVVVVVVVVVLVNCSSSYFCRDCNSIEVIFSGMTTCRFRNAFLRLECTR